LPEDTPADSPEEFTADDRASFQAELKKKNSEAQSLRNRLAEAEARLKTFEEAGITDPAAHKSELERLTTENAALTNDLNGAQLETARLRVGITKGIPLEVVARLKGADEAELSADADTLLPLLSGKTDPFPKADPSQGAHGPAGTPSTADQFAEQLKAAGF
jgi:hypothetical protein